MTPAQFNKERKVLVKEILSQVKPFFWPSGYVKHPAPAKCAQTMSWDQTADHGRVMLWVPRNAKGVLTMKSYSLQRALVLTSIEGFTDEGVITDGVAGGMVTTYWHGIPIEDLYRLNQWMKRMMPRLTAYDQAEKAKAKAPARATRSTAAAQAAA